jgi:hypothetical protein
MLVDYDFLGNKLPQTNVSTHSRHLPISLILNRES